VQTENPIIKDYELHYEKNEITDKDAILVVRKGMAFGIDGIIIKETSNGSSREAESKDTFRDKQTSERQSDIEVDKFNP
jgi:hypothetical protein